MSKELTALDQLRSRIELYRKGDLSLGTLIADLSYLHGAIDDQSDVWKQSVWERIGDLEQVNAVMLDMGLEEIDEIGRKIVYEAIEGLIGLAEETKVQGSDT